MAVIGFIVNPIAGMGGRVGLKGTDDMAAEAARLGATPIAEARALEALRELKRMLDRERPAPTVKWLTGPGSMGLDSLKAAGFAAIEQVGGTDGQPSAQIPSAEATKAAVRAFLDARVDLILFCGGDGTARDICSVAGSAAPVLGIPSGVKMYSGVFGVTPVRTAEICHRFLRGEIGVAPIEVLDLDEEKYRQGIWAIRLHMTATTPFEPSCLQTAKAIISEQDDDAVTNDIGQHLKEEIEAHPDVLLLLGPGGTVHAVGRALGVEKTLLGIDAFIDGRIVGSDLNEHAILALLERYPHSKLLLSPIGAQGFVLGRGNQQLSPTVIRRIGIDNIMVAATPAKLARTPLLRFDTGDAELDAELTEINFFPVIIGYRRTRLVRAA
jgi:predicted polyphosphate/ATP-dependent NAD kinase